MVRVWGLGFRVHGLGLRVQCLRPKGSIAKGPCRYIVYTYRAWTLGECVPLYVGWGEGLGLRA